MIVHLLHLFPLLQYAKELTGWLSALGANPCQHYNSLLQAEQSLPSLPYLVPLDKRNSELINSLLTLPKQLNEVGKWDALLSWHRQHWQDPATAVDYDMDKDNEDGQDKDDRTRGQKSSFQVYLEEI